MCARASLSDLLCGNGVGVQEECLVLRMVMGKTRLRSYTAPDHVLWGNHSNCYPVLASILCPSACTYTQCALIANCCEFIGSTHDGRSQSVMCDSHNIHRQTPHETAIRRGRMRMFHYFSKRLAPLIISPRSEVSEHLDRTTVPKCRSAGKCSAPKGPGPAFSTSARVRAQRYDGYPRQQ